MFSVHLKVPCSARAVRRLISVTFWNPHVSILKIPRSAREDEALIPSCAWPSRLPHKQKPTAKFFIIVFARQPERSNGYRATQWDMKQRFFHSVALHYIIKFLKWLMRMMRKIIFELVVKKTSSRKISRQCFMECFL